MSILKEGHFHKKIPVESRPADQSLKNGCTLEYLKIKVQVKGNLYLKILSSDLIDFFVESYGEGPRSKFE